MQTFIYLLAIYGLTFMLSQKDGPYGILNLLRNWLFSNSLVGTFFYKMFECYFCLGFHAGWIVYLISPEAFHWGVLLLWGLSGATFCYLLHTFLLFLDSIINKYLQ